MQLIERRIRDEKYSSPSTARAAVKRSHLGKKDRERLLELIAGWQERLEPPVIGGVPPADEQPRPASEVPAQPAEVIEVELPAPAQPERSILLNLNDRVRVRLTLQGMAQVYSMRSQVHVPDDLVERQGVWETELWNLMLALGGNNGLRLGLGEEPIRHCEIEVLGLSHQPIPRSNGSRPSASVPGIEHYLPLPRVSETQLR